MESPEPKRLVEISAHDIASLYSAVVDDEGWQLMQESGWKELNRRVRLALGCEDEDADDGKS